MADRPILFSAPMVRALLDGRKTQTRRIMKPQPTINSAGLLVWQHGADFIQGTPDDIAAGQRIKAGDRLWVKERAHIDGLQVNFAAGLHPDLDISGLGYRPSIHMPRWASRITLYVTEVRVERLQDISRDDVLAEGIRRIDGPVTHFAVEDGGFYAPLPKLAFRYLWDSINGPNAWDANPWVAAYTFTAREKNIDQVPA